MIGRLEEFPSLKSPPSREPNPFRRKKRKMILYFFYIFSVVAMYRLVMTMHWCLYTLDLKKLRLNKMTYDTESWERVKVDLSFKNSQSPIHVRLTDISAKLFCVNSDDTEHLILSLRVPAANLTKNRNVEFKGNIYIEDFNKKNAINSRFSVKFIVKVDARLYPRLCFLRFPFHRSSDFSLDNSVSTPSKGMSFKQISACGKRDRLMIKVEIDDTKFRFPKFVVLKSSGIAFFPKEREILDMVVIGPVDIERAEFLEPFSIQFYANRKNGIELKKRLIRVLRGDEVGFELDSFCFRDANGEFGSERLGLNLRFGFNAEEPNDYHMTFNSGGPALDFFDTPLIRIGNSQDSKDSHFYIEINKHLIPCMSKDSYIVVPTKDRVKMTLRFGGVVFGDIDFIVSSQSQHILLTGEFKHFNPVKVLEASEKKENREIEFVLSSSSNLGILVDNFIFKYKFSGVVEISFEDEKYAYSLKGDGLDDPTNEFDIFHNLVYEGDKLCVETSITFNPLENCNGKPFYSIELRESKYLLEKLGVDVEIMVLDSVVKYVKGSEPLEKRIFGSLRLRTKFLEDVGSILDFVARCTDSSYKPGNLVAEKVIKWIYRNEGGIISKDKVDSESEIPSYNKPIIKYLEEKSSITDHFLSISLRNTNPVQRKPSFIIRSTMNIPELELYLRPKSDSGAIPRVDKYSRENEAPNSGYNPVKVDVENAKLMYIWTSESSWFQTFEDINIHLTISHLHDLVVLVTRGISAYPADASNVISRNMSHIIHLEWPKRQKRITVHNIIVSSDVTKIQDMGENPVDYLYKIQASISFPVEMLESAPFSLDLPELRVRMATETVSRHLHPKKTFFSMKVLSGVLSEKNSSKYKSIEMTCIVSEFPPENISTNGNRSIINLEDGPKKDVFIRVHFAANDVEYEPISISKKAYKEIMAYIRSEVLGNSPGSGEGEYSKPTLRIESDECFLLSPTGYGFSTWCDFRKKDIKWRVVFQSEALNTFLYVKLRKLIPKLSCQIIPSGIFLELNLSREAIAFYVSSKHKNECIDKCPKGPANKSQPQDDEDYGRIKPYKIIDVIFGNLSFSKTISYNDFFLPELKEAKTKEEGHEVNAFPRYGSKDESEDYKKWDFRSLFGIDAYILNEGAISIPGTDFESPLISILTNLFPSHLPYKPDITTNLDELKPPFSNWWGWGLFKKPKEIAFAIRSGLSSALKNGILVEIKFPLPFDLIITSDKPLIEIDARSYCKDNTSRKTVAKISSAPLNEKSDPDAFYLKVHVPLSSELFEMTKLCRCCRTGLVWAHIHAYFYVDGGEVCNYDNLHVIIEDKNLKGLGKFPLIMAFYFLPHFFCPYDTRIATPRLALQ